MGAWGGVTGAWGGVIDVRKYDSPERGVKGIERCAI